MPKLHFEEINFNLKLEYPKKLKKRVVIITLKTEFDTTLLEVIVTICNFSEYSF